MKSTSAAAVATALLLSLLLLPPAVRASSVEVLEIPDPTLKSAPPSERHGQTIFELHITPSAAQTEEVDILQTLTLTEDQWQEIRKYCPFAKKRLGPVLTAAAAKHSADPFPIVVSDQDGRIILLCDRREGITCSDYAADLFQKSAITLTVDRRGRFYYDGRLIPFDQLVAATDSCAPPQPDQKKTAEIVIPSGMTLHDAPLHDRLQQLYTLFATHGWNDRAVPPGFDNSGPQPPAPLRTGTYQPPHPAQ